MPTGSETGRSLFVEAGAHALLTILRFSGGGPAHRNAMRQRWSISRKLFLLVLASVMVGLLAAATLSIWIEADRYLATRQRELQAVAQVFASATASAAAARDPVAARNAMRAIGQIAGMQHARIETLDGRTLAEMGVAALLDSDLRIGGTEPISVWRALRTRSVQVTVPIRESGGTVGRFVLVGDASDLTANLLRTLRVAMLCALFALAVGLSVAARLQRGITAPLRNLTFVLERIRKTHDYAARIEATSDDEVGRLVDSFNETLGEIRKRDRELEKLAYYDPLTGLANRALFRRTLDDGLSHCGRTGTQGALLLLDLDRFKEVNDTLGHAAGDELLIKVAHLIGRVLPEHHFLARLGGDEFAIMVPECGDASAIERLAAEVIAAISGSIVLERGEVTVETSIGIVLIPGDGPTASDLLRNADLALYRAKEEGRGRFVFFKPDMHIALQRRTELARDLHSAISENVGLSVHYQPQIDLATGRVTAFEALMRWNHPTRGSIPPSEFIPVAENSRLICDLGLWVLRHAALQAKAWLDAGEPPREVAVNVSTAQIWHADLVRQVADVLEQTGLPPHLLCIELTESLLADYAEGHVRTVLKALKGLGVRLALDDFGTDYSSLGYLARLPFDKLKIDRLFVDGITDSDRARELVKGIIALGRGLGMAVVAEGTEKPREVEILRGYGCDLAQGYVFARPTVAADALEFARRREAGALLVDTPSSPAQVPVVRLPAAAA
jgi:diguanylate cyclase (GGDEF)-like protein